MEMALEAHKSQFKTIQSHLVAAAEFLVQVHAGQLAEKALSEVRREGVRRTLQFFFLKLLFCRKYCRLVPRSKIMSYFPSWSSSVATIR